MKIRYIILFSLIFILPLVSATNPFIANQNTLGLNIDPLVYGSVQQNQPFTLNVHVYNISNGLNMTNNSVNCYAHLYDTVGDTLIRTPLMWDNQTGFDFTFNANNFSQLGQHSLEIWCNSDGILGGNERVIFNVTADGQDYQSFPLVYVLIILAIVFLILGRYQGKVFKTDIWDVFAGILFMISGVLTLTTGFNFVNSTNLGGLAFGIILIGIGAVVTYYSNSEVFD